MKKYFTILSLMLSVSCFSLYALNATEMLKLPPLKAPPHTPPSQAPNKSVRSPMQTDEIISSARTKTTPMPPSGPNNSFARKVKRDLKPLPIRLNTGPSASPAKSIPVPPSEPKDQTKKESFRSYKPKTSPYPQVRLRNLGENQNRTRRYQSVPRDLTSIHEDIRPKYSDPSAYKDDLFHYPRPLKKAPIKEGDIKKEVNFDKAARLYSSSLKSTVASVKNIKDKMDHADIREAEFLLDFGRFGPGGIFIKIETTSTFIQELMQFNPALFAPLHRLLGDRYPKETKEILIFLFPRLKERINELAVF